MKHLMKGIRIAAYIAEIIVASSTIVELVEKYSGRCKQYLDHFITILSPSYHHLITILYLLISSIY